MNWEAQVQQAIAALSEYEDLGPKARVDRREVIAHALLSGFAQHWPSRCDNELRSLLQRTSSIRTAEPSRWMTQRRIGIAKLATAINSSVSQIPAMIGQFDTL